MNRTRQSLVGYRDRAIIRTRYNDRVTESASQQFLRCCDLDRLRFALAHDIDELSDSLRPEHLR